MPAELPFDLILLMCGAFLAGWLLSSASSRIGSRARRDPRDDRIRALEAELRIARSDAESIRDSASDVEEQLKETVIGLERRDNVITEQQQQLDEVRTNLRDSVLKTRELRTELAERRRRARAG